MWDRISLIMLNSIMMTKFNVFPCSKGAGQEVGKSCMVVNINGKKTVGYI